MRVTKAMRIMKKWAALPLLVGTVAVLGGCPGEEGALERAGREMDEAAEKLEDEARELAGEGEMERLGRKLEDAAEDLGE